MKNIKFYIGLILFFIFGLTAISQNRIEQKEIALEIMNQAQFCSLITIDVDGFPEARMMQTLPVKENFVIWLGTKPNTQKVTQIKNNPNVSVYYTEAHSTGYVNVQGRAEIVNDSLSKEKYWKTGWEAFYPDKEKDFVLIKITPEKLQLVSYAKGIVSKDDDWRAVEFVFDQ